MTIPNDPEGRWWVEAGSANPDYVDKLRPSLVTFVAADCDYQHGVQGTGFVIAGDQELALVLTAKHVLTEGAVRAQYPHPLASPSSLFSAPPRPSLNPLRLRAFWLGTEHCDVLKIMDANYNDALDIALCVVAPQTAIPKPFAPTAIPIDTAVPNVGDVVHIVSQGGLFLTELAPPSGSSGKNQEIRFHRRVSVRVGVVTGVHPDGFRQYKWPCFTTSVPVEGGMSGGFATLPRPRKPIAACGVVCADNPCSDACNQQECGESVVACAWPALALKAPEVVPSASATPRSSLHELMQRGRLNPVAEGLERVRILTNERGDATIERRL